MKYPVLAALSLSLGACVSSTPPPAPTKPVNRPSIVIPAKPIDKRGLEAVMGKDANTLIRLFGQPRLDVVEVYGRKLQFSGKACILDAYLYPDGRNEIVTHVDARRSDGAEVDRVACVNALLQH